MTQIIDENWKLQSLNINKSWNSSDMQDYTGKIKFVNGKQDEISFSIPPEKMTELLQIISGSVVNSARELGQGLIHSIQKQAPPAIENNPASPDNQLTDHDSLPF